jgi:hypothetical protein
MNMLNQSLPVHELERGDIFFICRPRVNQHTISEADDVARLLILLRTTGNTYRLLVVGRKLMPSVRRHERAWGLVGKVTDTWAQLRKELGAYRYSTKTGKKQSQAHSRIIARGRYVIAAHGKHTHLAYRVGVRMQHRYLAKELKIEPDASLILLIKKPTNLPFRGEGTELANEDIPDEVWERFHSSGYMAANPAQLLDIENVQFTLIGAHNDIEKELGLAV